MKLLGLMVGLAVLAGLSAGLCEAQPVISAEPGLIHYTEGTTLLDSRPIRFETGRFPQMHRDQVVGTERGRAEILLIPGTFVRIGEDASFRLLSDSLEDARVELLKGSMVLEVGEVTKYNLVTVIWKDAAVAIAKHGVYRLDSDPAALRVFDGEAVVTSEGRKTKVGKGKMLAFDGAWAVAKFDRDETDALDRWSGRRASYLAMVNLPTARAGARSMRSSYWGYNQYYGMFTYIPYNGIYNSYYGYPFYSPRAVVVIYNPPRVTPSTGIGGGIRNSPGYSTASSTSAGTSGTIAASSPASTSSSSSSSAPVARDTGNAGGARR